MGVGINLHCKLVYVLETFCLDSKHGFKGFLFFGSEIGYIQYLFILATFLLIFRNFYYIKWYYVVVNYLI